MGAILSTVSFLTATFNQIIYMVDISDHVTITQQYICSPGAHIPVEEKKQYTNKYKAIQHVSALKEDEAGSEDRGWQWSSSHTMVREDVS